MKMPYEKPAVKHTEQIEARAVSCGKLDTTTPTCQQVVTS